LVGGRRLPTRSSIALNVKPDNQSRRRVITLEFCCSTRGGSSEGEGEAKELAIMPWIWPSTFEVTKDAP
jgi:hypothetical protein